MQAQRSLIENWYHDYQPEEPALFEANIKRNVYRHELDQEMLEMFELALQGLQPGETLRVSFEAWGKE